MKVTITLAYDDAKIIAALKRFIVQASVHDGCLNPNPVGCGLVNNLQTGASVCQGEIHYQNVFSKMSHSWQNFLSNASVLSLTNVVKLLTNVISEWAK